MKREIILCSILLTACVAQQSRKVPDTSTIQLQNLVESPFGIDENINSYLNFLPKGTRPVKMVQRNIEYSKPIDTLINLKFKQSSVLFHKSNFNREILLGGSISNKEIVLANGIGVGSTRNKVKSSIIGFEDNLGDTIVIGYSNRKIKFIFNKKGILTKYTFHGSVE